MPNTSYQLEVATEKPKAIVFADDYIKKPLSALLRQKGLSVSSSGKGEYVIDLQDNPQAIQTAQQQGSKYLRLIIGSQPTPDLRKLNNWRIVKTDYLIGDHLPKNTVLANLITQSIYNQTLTFPCPKDHKLYPLSLQDLVHGIWQALILPHTNQKEFLILGNEVSAKNLAAYLETLGQTNQGKDFSSNNQLAKYDPQEIAQTQETLRWQPQTNWQETIKSGFQTLWQKIDPEENQPKQLTEKLLTKPETQNKQPKLKTKVKPSTETKTETVSKESFEPPTKPDPSDEEEVIVVDEQEDKIEQILSQFGENEKKTSPEKSEENPDTNKTKKNTPFLSNLNTGFVLKTFAGILGLLIVLWLIVWSKPITNLVLGGTSLRKAIKALPEQNWQQANSHAQRAVKHFKRSENFCHYSRLKFLLLGINKPLGKLAQVGHQASLTVKTSTPLAENWLSINQAVLKDKDINWQRNLLDLTWQQSQLSFQLDKLQGLLSTKWSIIPDRWKNMPQKAQESIGKISLALTQASEITPHLDWLMGANGQRRSYLVLLQNNMELRPTGGFIGSFALLTLEDGSLTNFEVKDVYEADGQLKGHVEPPTPIKNILGEANWYLRDSNWNPDFPKSAKNAEWFLNKELGRKVDGVIGFNLEAAKNIISAFGEIYLPDYDETITADNLFERAEYWTEKENFAGSHQKAAFLGVLGQQLFENIKAAHPKEYLQLSQALWKSMQEKEITVFVHQPQLATKLNQLNWDGSIRNSQCNKSNCFADYLYLVEANLGVNKANYFLKRGIEQSIDFQSTNKLNHTLKINYENTASSNNWPGGEYTAWLRIYLPQQTQVNKVISYNTVTNTDRKIYEADEIQEKIENNKQVLGFKIEVPIQTQKTVEVHFSQQFDTGNNNELGYLLYWQKQSGYRDTPTSVLVSYPQTWQPLQVNPAANVVSDKLLFNQKLDQDIKLGIQFGL